MDLKRLRPPDTPGSASRLSFWRAGSRSRRSSSIRARIVAKSSAARGLVTSPPRAWQSLGEARVAFKDGLRPCSRMDGARASKNQRVEASRLCQNDLDIGRDVVE